MNIFVCIPWFSPAYKAGGPIQSILNMIEEFTEGINYMIFCGDSDLDNKTLSKIEICKWTQFNDWTKVWYAPNENRSETLIHQVEMTRPDKLFIVGLYSWHFNMVPLLFIKSIPKIVSVRGMLHPGALSQKKWKKKIYLSTLKLSGIPKKVIFHATDDNEKKYVEEVFGRVDVRIATNFPRRFSSIERPSKVTGRLSLISIALISPMKNHLLVLEALQLCPGDITYNICGPVKDPLYWEQCELLIRQLPPNIKVNYLDDVEPGQVEAMLKGSHVFILPSKSENFGHAIFEALSAGLPVITSTFTPWNSLELSGAGKNVELSISSITDAIDSFVKMDNNEYVEHSRGAKNYSEKALDNEKIRMQYQEMFDINEKELPAHFTHN